MPARPTLHHLGQDVIEPIVPAAVITLLATNPTVLAVCVFLFGLIVGSFLNVVIFRLPIMMEREWREQCTELLSTGTTANDATEVFNLVQPRSRCPTCARPITALQNVPLLSYILMRGRCACGEQRIAAQYPLVELSGGVLAAIVAWHYGFGWQALFAIVLTWALISLSVIDMNTQLLPDSITQPLLWLGLLVNVSGVFTDLESAVLGAIFGYLILWIVYQVFKIVAKKEGMGYGDFKLLAMLGAWMGWQMLPLTIVLSSLVGSVVGVTLIVTRGRDRNLPMPFGPYLAAAGWISLLWGNQISGSYMRWVVTG
jgi:leader peptidase (prepilin peptidase)/N-methyltransferase